MYQTMEVQISLKHYVQNEGIGKKSEITSTTSIQFAKTSKSTLMHKHICFVTSVDHIIITIHLIFGFFMIICLITFWQT